MGVSVLMRCMIKDYQSVGDSHATKVKGKKNMWAGKTDLCAVCDLKIKGTFNTSQR